MLEDQIAHAKDSVSPVSLSVEERLWLLEAERAIRQLVHRYADSADRREWGRFMEAFHEGATHQSADIHARGPQINNTKLAAQFFSKVPETHHMVGNVDIRVSGTKAVSQCYFFAHHIIPPDASIEHLPENRRPETRDHDWVWLVGGRYFDEVEYRDGRWGIVNRTAVHDWEMWLPPATGANGGMVRNLSNEPAPIDTRLPR